MGREQRQFLDVIDRDEAERRFRAVLRLDPLGVETIAIAEALGRVLASDVMSPVDVPCFDRSNVDGFAVRAADTFGASEEQPARLETLEESIPTGVSPKSEVADGTAMMIATGGMMPRGADGVVMVEHTRVEGDTLVVTRPVVPGAAVSFAGSDIGRGETVLGAGERLTSRETGVLAAIGVAAIDVFRRPRVAILSTGDEILAPGEPMRPGLVYDSNGAILADAVRELGGEPISLGIVRDDEAALRAALDDALERADVVLLSGGTSKGEGDLCYRVVADLPKPGVVVHGVALKPGKPICLAATPGDRESAHPKPVVILPGFPTSAIFTFHEFVAPVIRALGGRGLESRAQLEATMPLRVTSNRGRTEYVLVGLVEGPDGLAAYPMGKGSGSVTTFSRADGFVTIPRDVERVDEGARVSVTALGRGLEAADLVVIGSHCLGLDRLLAHVRRRGLRVKAMSVGSTGGLIAARRGECDIAGIHLLDDATDEYNRAIVGDDLELVKGYRRRQGVVFRSDDERFADVPRERSAAPDEAAVAALVDRLLDDASCRMVNRNRGSGTRILVDRLLGDRRPPGLHVEVKSHNAVVAAVAQGRADWGVAIETAARDAGLGFIALRDEEFDFAIPPTRIDRLGVVAFLEVLRDPAVREQLRAIGFGDEG